MISNFYSTLLFLFSFAFTLAQNNNSAVDSLIIKERATITIINVRWPAGDRPSGDGK